jgi:hypothetical protein
MAPISPISLNVPAQLTVHASQTSSLNPITQMTPTNAYITGHTPTIRYRNGHDATSHDYLKGPEFAEMMAPLPSPNMVSNEEDGQFQILENGKWESMASLPPSHPVLTKRTLNLWRFRMADIVDAKQRRDARASTPKRAPHTMPKNQQYNQL